MNFIEYLGIAVAPSLTLGLVIFLARNWFLERLKNSIKHEYDLSLEKFKSELKHDNDKSLENLKADLKSNNDLSLEKFKGELKSDKDKELEDLKALLKQKTDENLEDFKYQVEVKKKAELVAKLLAHWVTRPDNQEDLNRMTFECFLWLPDDIATDLGALLSHKRENEVTLRSVIVKIRKHLHIGKHLSKFDKLEPWQVIQFNNESLKKVIESKKGD